MTFDVSETRNKQIIAEFCRRDPTLYAYYLGDLDEFFFDRTRWWVATDSVGGEVAALTLWYQSASLLVIQGLGKGAPQERIWREILPLCPTETHAHYHVEHEKTLAEYNTVNSLGTFYKMRLEKPPADSELLRLSANAQTAVESDLGDIEALQARGYPSSYFDQRLLQTGYCAIARNDQKAIAFAACHVCSNEYNVASLGAITTDPDYRRQGFATAVTAKILRTLQGDISNICLNVHSENTAAIGVYRKLGFEIHCEYQEAILGPRSG